MSDSITPREERVIKMRFGTGDCSEHTLEEVGRSFQVTREGIRQIEAKALRKLRHPSRSRKLKAFLEGSRNLTRPESAKARPGRVIPRVVHGWHPRAPTAPAILRSDGRVGRRRIRSKGRRRRVVLAAELRPSLTSCRFSSIRCRLFSRAAVDNWGLRPAPALPASCEWSGLESE